MTLIQELVFPDRSSPQEPISLIRAKLDASARLASLKFAPNIEISDLELELNERIETAAAHCDLKVFVQASNHYHEIVQLYWSLDDCFDARRRALASGRFVVPTPGVDPDAFCMRLANCPLFVSARQFRRLMAPIRPRAFTELSRWIYHSLAKRNERITWEEFAGLIERTIGSTRAAELHTMWKILPRTCKMQGRPESGRLPPTVTYFTSLEDLKRDQTS